MSAQVAIESTAEEMGAGVKPPAVLGRVAASTARTRASADPRLRVLSWVLCALAFGLVLGGVKLVGAHPSDLTRDPTAMGDDVKPWYGAISQVGLLVWGAGAASCLTVAMALWPLWDRRTPGAGGSWPRYLAVTGGLVAYAGLDDGLQIHEYFIPDVVGLPSLVGVALLGAGAVAWAWRFHRSIAASDLLLLGFAVVCFGGSVVLDGLEERVAIPIALEDWFKDVGLVAFVAWCFGESRRALRAHVGETRTRGA
jgi:hypothetical protein